MALVADRVAIRTRAGEISLINVESFQAESSLSLSLSEKPLLAKQNEILEISSLGGNLLLVSRKYLFVCTGATLDIESALHVQSYNFLFIGGSIFELQARSENSLTLGVV